MEMTAIAELFNRADAFAAHNGMAITELKEGFARATMELQPFHLNAAGTVHGGALFTLADFAFAAASNSRGQLALSINSSIAIFRGAKTGVLTAEAREVSHAPKLSSFEVAVHDADKRLLATFQGMAYRKSVPLESIAH